ncbi:lectin-like [Clupea harengus]|uniref:Lectin-like n=1 Tax=Clupea harengus TaxID=7950 RepID=A0A6P8GHV3_CLUHA|nr:lectin-like [Clupea harengus]
MSWRLAQLYCRDNHTDLASVTNLEENQHLYEISKNQPVWIGLFRDSWTWSDGANSSFRLWYSGEPDNYGGIENCSMIRHTEDLWGVNKCANHYPFLCYKELNVQNKSTMKVKLKFDSPIDMEDPVVQAAILQQIHKQLQERGLPSDTKVTWKKQIDGKVFHKE